MFLIGIYLLEKLSICVVKVKLLYKVRLTAQYYRGNLSLIFFKTII